MCQISSWTRLPFSSYLMLRYMFKGLHVVHLNKTLLFLFLTAQGGDGHGWDWARPAAGEVRKGERWGGRRRRRWRDGGQNWGLKRRRIKGKVVDRPASQFQLSGCKHLSHFITRLAKEKDLLNPTWTQGWLSKFNSRIVSVWINRSCSVAFTYLLLQSSASSVSMAPNLRVVSERDWPKGQKKLMYRPHSVVILSSSSKVFYQQDLLCV